MKISRISETTPKNISELPVDYTLFRKREALHKDIPTFCVYISDSAWVEFINHATNVYRETKHEAQGIFTGQYYADKLGKFVIANKYEIGYGNSSPVHVEMSYECQAEISNRCQKEDTLMLIWIHSHLGYSTDYSSTDNDNLKINFFRLYQIGIVVDIIINKHKSYKIENFEVVEFKNYILFNESKKILYHPYCDKIDNSSLSSNSLEERMFEDKKKA